MLLHSLPSYCTIQVSSQSIFSQPQLLAPSQSSFLMYNPSIFSIYLLATPAPCSPSQPSFLLYNPSIFSIYLLATPAPCYPSQPSFLLYNPSIFSICLLTTFAPCFFTVSLFTVQPKHLLNLSSRNICSFTVSLFIVQPKHLLNLSSHNTSSWLLNSLPFYCTSQAYSQSIFSQTPSPCSFIVSVLTEQLKHLLNLSSHKHHLLAPSQSPFLLYNFSSFTVFFSHKQIIPPPPPPHLLFHL